MEASIEGTPLAYTENDGAVAITSTLAVTDVDDTNMESAVVQITVTMPTVKTCCRSWTRTELLVLGTQPMAR
ncbi:MAG: hypothetical protein R3C05_04405 [Pirellulaceae bacterium]